MKKFFWLMAAVLISSMSIVSCGGDDDDDSKTPSKPQGSSTYNITASAIFDKEMAKYGYMEVSYDYNGKTEKFQLRQGDKSDALPAANGFSTKMLQIFNSNIVDYSGDNFIIHNVILNNVDNKVDVVFKYKFVLDPETQTIGEDAKYSMAQPAVVGYAEADANAYLQFNTTVLFSIGVRPDKFEDFLKSAASREHTTTFTRGK